MNETTSEFAFSVLFDRAISCWPELIKVTELVENKARPELYVVIGLGEMADAIAEKFSDETDAVLMMSFHDAIYSTIRSAALFCTVIRLKSLRLDTVRKNLELRLHRAIANSELGWNEDQILLVKRYFLANQ